MTESEAIVGVEEYTRDRAASVAETIAQYSEDPWSRDAAWRVARMIRHMPLIEPEVFASFGKNYQP